MAPILERSALTYCCDEQIGILPEASRLRIPRSSAAKQVKLRYTDELEINRPKILQGPLRTLDIALAEALINYFPYGCRKASNPHCSENVSMMPATSC